MVCTHRGTRSPAPFTDGAGMGSRGPAEKCTVSIFPTDMHKSSPFGRMEPISNTECRGRWVKKALSVQLCGFSVLPGGRNPWKKQAVFRNDLGEVQEIPCSSFNFPEPLLKSQIL